MTPIHLPNPKSQRGASLVEILVVMVVLVVGIFTIIRIFPIGFDVLQYTGNVSVAERLATAEVDYWRHNQSSLPDGFAAVLPSRGGQVNYDSTARPNDFVSGTGGYGDLSNVRQDTTNALRQAGMPSTEDDVDLWVGQNRARRVLGETVPIPGPSPVDMRGETVASVYSLAYSPIDWPAENPTDQNVADQYLQIRGNALTVTDVTGVSQPALDGILSQLRPRQVALDTKLGKLWFARSDRSRAFVARYTYRSSAELRTLRNDRIYIGPTPNVRGQAAIASEALLGVAQAGSPLRDSAFNGIEPNTLDVASKFRYIPTSQSFSVDPYEYKVVTNTGQQTAFNAALAFNPRGYNQKETLAGGVNVPLRARIDYTVKDWRILHQDVTLPEGEPYRARLALPYLKQANVTVGEGSLTAWTGLTRLFNNVSIVAVDLSNGALVYDDVKNNGFTVDYRNGVLTFPKNLRVFSPSGKNITQDPAGHSYRVFFEVEGDWAVVPQKAFADYDMLSVTALKKTAGTAMAIPLGNAVLAGVGQDGQGRFVTLAFPTADEGKAVQIDYVYRTKSGQLRSVYGQEYRISSQERDPSWFITLGSAGATEVPKPFVKIYLPNDEQVKNADADFQVKQLRGASFRAVTVWRDRSRWRTAAVQTHLTRETL